MITQKQITKAVCNLYKEAVIELPKDVEEKLKEAYEKETHELGQLNLKAINDNIKLAKENKVPMCQDTGLPIFFVKLGNVQVENLYQSIKDGVKEATKETPLRPNVVHPITRKNTGVNVGDQIPQIDIELTDKPTLEITVFPKGFGSENNNALKMGLPGDGIKGIKEFVLETVNKAQGKPCPPMIIGVGVGGSSDMAMKLAKKALLQPLGINNPDKTIAEVEKELLEKINKDGVGPMGLGGDTTALDVKILTAYTHTAGLPIGVCIQCWAGRHKTIILTDD